MLDTQQYKTKGLLIVVLFSLFACLFYALVSSEIFKLQSNLHFRYAMRTELNYYMNSEARYKDYIGEYIQDNYQVVDLSLAAMLHTAKAKLNNVVGTNDLKEEDIQNQIGFKDIPNNLEIFAIKKDDLFTSIKYRYILDEFVADGAIHMLKLNVFRDSDVYTVKRSAYFYEPRLSAIIVVEKTMEPELVNSGNIRAGLTTYSLVTNSKTLGDIITIDKSGKVLYDNHNIMDGKFLEGTDLTSQKQVMSLIEEKADGFVEFTLPADGKRKLAYVIYSKATESYYINMIDKSLYYEKGNVGRKEMLLLVGISMSIVACLLTLFVIRKTVRMLE